VEISASVWLAVGGIHEYMGNDAQAVECYQRSVTLFNESGNSVGEVEATTKLAGALGRRNDLTASLTKLLRALMLYEELDLPQKVAELLLEIGRLYQHNDEPQQALAYLQMARSRAQQQKAAAIEGTALLHIARLHLADSRIEQALQSTNEAFALELSSPHLAASLHEVAAAAHEARGGVATALEHYKLFLKNRNDHDHARQQELFTDLSTRLSFAQIVHEREQLDEDVNELRAQLTEKSREIATLGLRIIQRDRKVEDMDRQLERLASTVQQSQADIGDINYSTHRDVVDDGWQMFETLFDEAHRDFLRRLSSLHHSLTQTELKVCSLIRIGLTTKDIAQMLFVSVRNIQNHKYRLRKRLKLEAETTIESYLASV
jgi:DNA-binding CsgD family transcriptional regulator